tara:strand:+ start:4163 stop:4714 length:552 start_codon:yes stop_codon:yes gene_type:complete
VHSKNLNFFCFIDQHNDQTINRLPKNTSLIYRNYDTKIDEKEILMIKKICQKKGFKFYLSNNIKLAIKLGLDGGYIPSFNRSLKHNSFSFKPSFSLLGSAHNLKEIRIKETQKVKNIFISPIFFTQKNRFHLGIYKFLKLKKLTLNEITCLGGVNNMNISIIKMLKIKNIAGISLFQNLKKLS